MFWVVLAAVIAKGAARLRRHAPPGADGRAPDGGLGALARPARLGARAHRRWWPSSRSRCGSPALSDAVGSICIWVTGFGAGQWWGRPFWGTTVIVVDDGADARADLRRAGARLVRVPGPQDPVRAGRLRGGAARLVRGAAGPAAAAARRTRRGRSPPTPSCGPRADPGGRDPAGHGRRRRAGLPRLRRLRAREAVGSRRTSADGGPARLPAADGAGAPRAARGCGRPRSTWAPRSGRVRDDRALHAAGCRAPAPAAPGAEQRGTSTASRRSSWASSIRRWCTCTRPASSSPCWAPCTAASRSTRARLFEPVRALWPRPRAWTSRGCASGTRSTAASAGCVDPVDRAAHGDRRQPGVALQRRAGLRALVPGHAGGRPLRRCRRTYRMSGLLRAAMWIAGLGAGGGRRVHDVDELARIGRRRR